MSWKFSPSYAARDHSLNRETPQSKFMYSGSRFRSPSNERQSRWSSSVSGDSTFYKNPSEVVEHSPVWAKTSISDNPASVQRLKERYNISEEIKPTKRGESKEMTFGNKSGRPYGRSLTTLSIDSRDINEGSSFQSRLSRRGDKTPEIESPRNGSNFGSYENRKVLYMPTATTKLLTRKYSTDLSPTLNIISKQFPKVESSCNDTDTITVVTRGTSPTPTASSVYLRSKRSDFGLEKKVARSHKKVETANKEVQTEKEDSFSKYCLPSDVSLRSVSRPSYGSKYSGRSGFSSESRRDQLTPHGVFSDYRRSTSREESDEPSTPEFQKRSLMTRPPALGKTASPLKETDKKASVRISPPGGIRSSSKLDCAKSELAKNPHSPTHLATPLQCKVLTTEALQSAVRSSGTPKVTIDPSPDIAQAIDDVSSMSESSEEETSSDEDTEAVPPDITMSIKKSVTNFLQNIPNTLPQNLSRPNLQQKFSSLNLPKPQFRRIESGEKAWWMESPEKSPEDVVRVVNGRPATNQEQQNLENKSQPSSNFLSPYLINRQFSKDKDWLKGSSQDLNKITDNHVSKEDPPLRQNEINSGINGVAKGEGNFNVNSAFSKREQFSKSPDNFLAEEINHSMKFKQQTVDERTYLTDFSRECSIKDLSQKLQNGLGSPLEEKNLLEPGDMSGLISKAKAGLLKSKTKLDIKKSSSREMSPKVTDTKAEIDLYWKELADSLERPLRLCDLDFTDLNSDDDTDILGNSKLNGEVPPPPPMLILPVPTMTPLKPFNVPTPPSNANHQPARPSRNPAPQIVKNKKTVKLFWKEVKDEPAMQSKTSDGAVFIWDELAKVKVDTQKLEYLFESRAKDLMSKKQQEQNKNKEIIVLDPKRSNAINIGMTKLPPPRAIKTAILKMDSTVVNKEGIEKLLTMLPTEEEKLRIQEAQNLNPEIPLGSAEQFLLTLASINELEARLRLWAFKLDFENSEKEICEPLMDLKQGMEILKVNRTFRGILGTLLSIGNFLNGYDAKGFQIEYLSKVPEVKDTVHKHSLLHHLCIIVMDKFPDSTDLYSEIGPVTRASKVDFDELAANIKKVEEDCKLSWNYLKMIAKHEGHTAMKVKMSDFLADCAERIIILGLVHKRVMSRFQKFAFWLGLPMNKILTTRPNEIFKIISEFALEYRTTRDRVLQQIKKMNRDKSRTRGHLTGDANDMTSRKMNSKEAKDDARLKQLLGNDTENLNGTPMWRRQRKDTKTLLLESNNNDDEEILDALIKTANQRPALKERRRSRVYGKYCRKYVQTLQDCI